ncbi:MAG: fumarylacetoacetate hydrolase family protein, partial [Chitinophagaceae bacterium]
TPFYYPDFTNELHYEAEIVLRIAKNGRYISQRNASKYYNAYSLGIDFTARDIQAQLKQKGLPWEKAKAWDNSAILGDWIECNAADFPNPMEFSLHKNEEIVQQGNTKDMIFSFDTIVAYISNYFSLNIGDLVYTGTPAGVGECVVGDVLKGYIGNQKMLELIIK